MRERPAPGGSASRYPPALHRKRLAACSHAASRAELSADALNAGLGTAVGKGGAEDERLGIYDETIATDSEAVFEFLSARKHPAPAMDPLM